MGGSQERHMARERVILMMPAIAGLNKVFQAALTYLLKTDFSAVTGQPVTLTNGQVLDTAAEGMVAGSLTVVDASSINLLISANALLTSSGNNNNTYNTLGAVSGALTVAEGLIFKAVYTLSVLGNGHETYIGLKTTSGVNTTGTVAAFYPRGANTGRLDLVNPAGGNWLTGISVSSPTVFNLAAVILPLGVAFFIKGGAFTAWTLFYIDRSVTISGTNYFIVTSAYTISNLNRLAVTETLYPDLVQTIAEDDFSEADGTALSGKALDKGGNWTITYTAGSYTAAVSSGKATITAVSSNSSIWVTAGAVASDVLVTNTHTTTNAATGSHNVFILRDSGTGAGGDCIQCWLVNGASGGLTIYERTGGSVASRGSSTVSISLATAYECQARVVANACTFIVGATSVSGTLSSPTTNKKHGFGLVRDTTPSSVDNFKVYPATGYDEVLDAI